MNNKCIVCNSLEFDTILDYRLNRVVTSDNKIMNKNFLLLQCKQCLHIQKQIDKDFLHTIDKIYTNYEAYYLNEGKEEARRDDTSASRSKTILNNIKDIIPKDGTILDIGTGSGVFLKEFSKEYNWKLYAQDVKYDEKSSLLDIKNFTKFFLFGKDELLKNFFTIICAIHAFEHILDINSFLINIKESLKEDGILLLQIPNIHENIFDTFIIDHVSHFNKYIIYKVLTEHFKYVYFPKKQIFREITVIATNSPIDSLTEEKIEKYDNNLKFEIYTLLNKLTSLDEKIAIFGTSPPAVFCANLLNMNIEYFIDENEIKFNKKLYGKSIIDPKSANNKIKILFPYSKELLGKIKNKYPELNFIYIKNEL